LTVERPSGVGRSNEGARRGASAVRYPYLREACEHFLVDALRLLGSRPPVPAEPDERGQRAALYGWIEANREDLIALPGAARAASAVAKAQLNIGKVSDKDGKELVSKEYAPWRVFHIVLGPLVAQYVAENRRRLSFSARLYGTVYAWLEEYYSVGPLVRFVAPLDNFGAEGPRVRLEPGLSIEPLSQADLQRLVFYFRESSPLQRDFVTGPAKWAMVMLHHSHPFAPFSGDGVKFDALLLALRLVKSEPVGYRCVVHYPAGRSFYAAVPEGASWNMRPRLRPGPPYVLGREDQAQVRSILRCLADDTVLRGHPIALSRFDDAYWRGKAEDALVDAWIALESLFAPPDPGEATYRLALRIAYFLGRTAQQRLAIDKDIRDSYKLRSNVVHGRSYSRSDLKAFTDKTSDYLRRALRVLVQRGETLDTENVGKIDRAVRAGKNPRDMK
jgi:hypothetical protein